MTKREVHHVHRIRTSNRVEQGEEGEPEMSASQVTRPWPTGARPLTDDPNVDARVVGDSEGGGNALEDDILLWHLDVDGWD